MFLFIAGEILLGIALIMGLSAVVTILLRMCTRSRLSRDRRITSFTEGFDRNDNRTSSLSSLQRTIIDKMRDRPPRYETRHNYEYRRREQSEEEYGSRNVGIRCISILNPGVSERTNCEPPPTYETGENSSVFISILAQDDLSIFSILQGHELPPVYSIINEIDCPQRQQESVNRVVETPQNNDVLHMWIIDCDKNLIKLVVLR